MSERKFPLFIDLSGKKILIFGGGHVALRRATALVPFGADLTVIAPEVLPEFTTIPCLIHRRVYRPGEIGDAFLVLAATDDPEVNHTIATEAKGKALPVNNASNRHDCDFYFPALVVTDHLTVGITGTGHNHKEVRQTAETIREVIR